MSDPDDIERIKEKAKREERERIINIVIGEIDLAYLIRAKGEDITGMNVLSQLKERMRQALGEKC